MARLVLLALLLIEIFALTNRGGGPLLSHLFLTGVMLLIMGIAVVRQPRWKLTLGLPELSYFGFLLLFVASLFVSLTPSYGLSELLLFVNGGLLFLVIRNLDFSEKELHWFSIGLLGIGLIEGLIGAYLYTHTPFPRFAGTFIDLGQPYTSFANDFANVMLLLVPLSLWYFFQKHQRITSTILSGLTASILFAGFCLSFSRAAWISFVIVAIVTLVWGVISTKRKEFRTSFVSIKEALVRFAAFALITTLLVSGLQAVRTRNFETNSFVKKLLFQSDEEGASASERIEFWKGAAKIIGDRPLLGSGVLSFKYLFPKYQPIFGINWDHPHNTLLKIGVENGVIAALFFLSFIVTTAIILVRFLWQHPWHPVLPLLLGALASFGHNLIDFNYIVGNFIFFMGFLALGLAFAKKYETTHNPAIKTPLYVMFILSLALTAFALHDGYYNKDFKAGRAALAPNNYEEPSLTLFEKSPSYKYLTAINLLEESKNLIFERDLDNYLAAAYRKHYETSSDSTWHKKEIELLEKVAPTTLDASLLSHLGELYVQEKRLANAEAAFRKAIELDPINEFKYYYQLFEVQKKQGKKVDESLRTKILALLEQYKPFLKKNSHYTVITQNPEYASKLYEFFGRSKDKEEVEFFWLKEYLKFKQKYP